MLMTNTVSHVLIRLRMGFRDAFDCLTQMSTFVVILYIAMTSFPCHASSEHDVECGGLGWFKKGRMTAKSLCVVPSAKVYFQSGLYRV